MKRQIFTGITAAALCLTGCGTSEKESGYIRNKETAYYDMSYNVYDNGLIYQVNYDQAYFLDYETMSSIPLCNKPNCTHSSASCISNLCLSSSPMTFVYQDYVYWFTSDSQIVDSEDGKTQRVEVLTKCMRAALSTGEVETFVEIPDVFMNSQIDMVIVGNVLYIIGGEEYHQEENGIWAGYGRSGPQYLYTINLETAQAENHGRVNDSPYAEYNWSFGGSVHSEVEIDGVYEGKIYMHYWYVDDPQLIMDAVNNKSFFDAQKEIPWQYENKCYDPKTGEMTVSDLPYAWWICDDTYVYLEGDTFYVMDQDGNAVPAPNIQKNGSYDITFVNGKLWKCTSGGGFDPKTGEVISLAEPYTADGTWILDYVNDEYVVQYYDADYNIQFDFVNEEELRGETSCTS
ncbi:hypothetical protein [Ruminococcus sp.]|uniref:hypothetical protein n=1 Tax=Ruminococcus sp. TaxID=41978 RepID=UPI0025DE2631|nr:hypothetical protein [Ruminococcus sp.]